MRFVTMMVVAAMALGCGNAEEKKRLADEKRKAFMEAEAAARTAEDEREKKAALDAATSKCDGKDAAGCLELGNLRLKDKDAAAAVAAFDKACALKDKQGCMLAGSNSAEPKEALARYQRGCALSDADACVAGVAALDKISQQGGEIDPKAQHQLLDRACNLGIGRTCTVLGVLNKDTDVKLAAGAFDRGCKAKEPTACVQLGDLYKNGKVGKKKDPKKAAELFKKACDLGLVDVCQP